MPPLQTVSCKSGSLFFSRDALVLLFGMAMFWPSRSVFGQVLMLFGAQDLFIGGVHSGPHSLISIVAVIACSALVALLDFRGILTYRCMRWLVGAVALALLLSIALLGVMDSWLVGLVALGATSCLFVLLSYGWAKVALGFDPRVLGLLFVLSMPLGTLVSFVLQVAPLPWGMTATASEVLPPLASSVLLCLACPMSGCMLARPRPGLMPAGPWFKNPTVICLVLIVAYLLCTSVLRTAYTYTLPQDESLYKSLLAKALLLGIEVLMVGAALVLWRRRAGESIPWLPFIAVCLVALYMAVALFNTNPDLCLDIIYASRQYAMSLVYMTIFWAACAAGTRAPRWTAILYPGYVLTNWLVTYGAGIVFSSMKGHADLWLLPVTAVTLIVVTALAGVYLSLQFGWATRQRAGMSGNISEFRHRVCARIAAEQGLTERERDVLELVSQGHGQKKVAADLGISEHTVHSYAKSLYAKLDVHNRQECIDYVEGSMAGR